MKLTTPLHFHRQRSLGTLLFAVGLCLAAVPDKARAAAVLTGTATFNISTNDYTYSYSVTNTGTEALVIVTIPAFPILGVSAAVSPTGFWQTYDPSQKVVNLMEDFDIITPQTFAPLSTVGFFSFNSATAPGLVTFSAFDATGNESNGLVVSPVPEPAGALLGGLAAAGMLLRRRRVL